MRKTLIRPLFNEALFVVRSVEYGTRCKLIDIFAKLEIGDMVYSQITSYRQGAKQGSRQP